MRAGAERRGNSLNHGCFVSYNRVDLDVSSVGGSSPVGARPVFSDLPITSLDGGLS
jgi:hypothetical protein